MITDREFTRRMLQTVVTAAIVVIVVIALWAAREALLLIYVSALIAMGFAPVFGIITILILSFYLLIEAESLFLYVTRFVPEPQRAKLKTASREAVLKVSAWLRAQFVLAGVMGVFAAVGLGLMGEPYFYVVAL